MIVYSSIAILQFCDAQHILQSRSPGWLMITHTTPLQPARNTCRASRACGAAVCGTGLPQVRLKGLTVVSPWLGNDNG